MRQRSRAILLFACVLAGFLGLIACPVFGLENRVTVESKTFYPGQTACTVGVFFENAVPLTAVVLPFEIREIDRGAYPAGVFWKSVNGLSRFGRSPVAGCDPGPTWPAPCLGYHRFRVFAKPDSLPSCGGEAEHRWANEAAIVDYVSPDALFWAGVSTGDTAIGEDIDFDPGSDPIKTDSAGIWIGFSVSTALGQFEIDTCCIMPANHLAYVDLNTQLVVPEFTKGVITIACQCPCASDPNCDGVSTDILDVFETINVAFRGTPAVQDPGCARSRTDVNCDGVTDVVDAVVVGMVSFGGLDPAVYYCVPCE